MKVAHFGRFTPNASGQFESIKDMMVGEKAVGIEPAFIDCGSDKDDASVCYVHMEDDGLHVVDPKWALDADIFVRHSIIPPSLEKLGKPTVMMLHGRPENSFLLEHYEKTPVYSLVAQKLHPLPYKAFVTYWNEFIFNWEFIVSRNKLFSIPSAVNLDKYTVEGKTHQFGELSGSPNIVIVDVWREDVTPYNVLHATALFKEKYAPNAKIHIFGLPSNEKSAFVTLIESFCRKGVIGQAYTLFKGLERVYRAADIVVTPHNMATRIVRESLACGTPVVAGTGCSYTPYTADSRHYPSFAKAINDCWQTACISSEVQSTASRVMAEKCFNPKEQGRQIKRIFDKLLITNKSNKMRFWR